MKIILEYNETTGVVTLPDGYTHHIPQGSPMEVYKEGADRANIVQLVSLGVSAEDLLKLKTNGII